MDRCPLDPGAVVPVLMSQKLGGIADRREKFKGRKGDKGGDPLFYFFVGRKTSPQFGKTSAPSRAGLVYY